MSDDMEVVFCEYDIHFGLSFGCVWAKQASRLVHILCFSTLNNLCHSLSVYCPHFNEHISNLAF